MIYGDSPKWTQALMSHLFQQEKWDYLINAICNRTCIAVTGVYYDLSTGLATACWVIEGKISCYCAKGAAQTPDNIDYMDPYRAELFGFYCV